VQQTQEYPNSMPMQYPGATSNHKKQQTAGLDKYFQDLEDKDLQEKKSALFLAVRGPEVYSQSLSTKEQMKLKQAHG
jgi:hypothetical protein